MSIILNGSTGITTPTETIATSATVAGVNVIAVAPSTSGNVLTSNGTAWVSSTPTSGGAINVQTFTTSGTWTKPSLAAGSRVFIQAWGGGGSGGKQSGTAGAGGGGGGGYIERWVTLSTMGSTETITIGAGGAAISANGNGNLGGNTTVGSLITGYGGGGGGGTSASTNNSQGSGGGQLSAGSTASRGPGRPYIITDPTQGSYQGSGYGTQGDAFMHGGGGGSLADGGSNASVWGGGGGGGGSATQTAGGTSLFGGNGGAGSTTAGTAGTQPGGGGGGSKSGNSGAGGDGQVIITVFPA